MASLNDYFEKIYILNLPYKPDRRERLDRHLKSTGLARKIDWVRAYSGDLMPPPAWWNAGNGAWGCMLSHARVVEESIMDRLSSYLVLEDDAIFHPASSDLLPSLMAQLPEDWGQFYLGGQHLREPRILDESPSILRAWNVNRTHAFALRDKVFTKYHQHIWHAPDYISKSGGWHIDHQLGIAHERGDWSVYAPLWWLAGQDSDWSNISGRQNPRLWWHPAFHSRKIPFIQIPTSFGTNLGASGSSLHGGNNLKPGTLEDIGLDEAVESDEKLEAWLKLIAREAVDMGRLPCWQHERIEFSRVSRIWKGGVVDLQGADIPRLVNYVWRG